MTARESGTDALTYTEERSLLKVESLPLAHLSIEAGHVYMEDFEDEIDAVRRLRQHFQRVEPWVRVAKATAMTGTSPKRISTCFLVDEYVEPKFGPDVMIGRLFEIAAECGVPLDYVARESGCERAGDVPLAEAVAAQLLPEPVPGTSGTRPSPQDSGWLCNGIRATETAAAQAMHMTRWRSPAQRVEQSLDATWAPSTEIAGGRHSVFVDVQLWSTSGGRGRRGAPQQRSWSCAFLAAVWHLLRLGMLRYEGAVVASPEPWSPDGPWPEDWASLPAVMQFNPGAAPFAAYRSVSIMPSSYLPTEHAVRIILEHLQYDEEVIKQIKARALREDEENPVSSEVLDRMSLHFM